VARNLQRRRIFGKGNDNAHHVSLVQTPPILVSQDADSQISLFPYHLLARPQQVQSLRLKVFASPGSKDKLFVARPRHWQVTYGTHGVHMLSKEDRQVKLKQIGAGNFKLPFKHDDGEDDKYLGFAFVKGLPRVFIVIAEAVAIIGGASIDDDSGSRIPKLLKFIGHPLPGDRRQLYRRAQRLGVLCFVRSAGCARLRQGRPRLRPQPALPDGRPVPRGKPLVSHFLLPCYDLGLLLT
jgi:hypothetical protein